MRHSFPIHFAVEYFRIGIYDKDNNNVFHWQDNTVVTWTNWANANEPHEGDSNWVLASSCDNWAWKDTSGTTFYYLCEA